LLCNFFQHNYILSLALFFTTALSREYIIQHQDMKDPLQQFYRNIAHGSETFIESSTSLSLVEIGQLFKMDYSVVSQAAKRFEQKSKVNHKISEIKQKLIAAWKEN